MTTQADTMSKVTTGASMSLAGYIGRPGRVRLHKLFSGTGNGDVTRSDHPRRHEWQLTRTRKATSNSYLENVGRCVVARRLFDHHRAAGAAATDRQAIVVYSTATHARRLDRRRGSTIRQPRGIGAADRERRRSPAARTCGLTGGTIASQALKRRAAPTRCGSTRDGAAGRRHRSFRRVEPRPGRPRGPGSRSPGQGRTH